jgi:hypothetical protein
MVEKKEIQDNIRETELRNLFNLDKENNSRIGYDAITKINNEIIYFELKSSTRKWVSSANKLNLKKIHFWRKVHWIIGIYNKDATLSHCYYGTPLHMKEWLDYWENDIKRGLKISDMLIYRIDYDMLYEVFGEKSCYTLQDAKFVYKNLFSTKQYFELMDCDNGFLPETMLTMFKLHNKKYLYSTASINNPYITYNVYKDWPLITDKFEKTLKKYISKYQKTIS